MSSACVAPTVVTICSGAAATPRSASRRDSALRSAACRPGRHNAARRRRGVAGGAAQRALQHRGVEPVFGQRAHAGRRAGRRAVEHAADQRRGVHRRGWAAPRWRAAAGGCGRVAHEEAALRPRLHQALGLQQVVGADHGGRAHALVAACAVAHRRQPRARRQQALLMRSA
jgi:hypothetical protein